MIFLSSVCVGKFSVETDKGRENIESVRIPGGLVKYGIGIFEIIIKNFIDSRYLIGVKN